MTGLNLRSSVSRMLTCSGAKLHISTGSVFCHDTGGFSFVFSFVSFVNISTLSSIIVVNYSTHLADTVFICLSFELICDHKFGIS